MDEQPDPAKAEEELLMRAMEEMLKKIVWDPPIVGLCRLVPGCQLPEGSVCGSCPEETNEE